MEILISYNYREEDLASLPLQELAHYVLASENKPLNTEVSISFVADEVIAELNAKYRGKEGPTDVLSFECDSAEEDPDVPTCADNAIYELGDVIIAPDVAERQTAEFNTTFSDEINLLLVHGLLHLCGYDHVDDDEAEVMEAREEKLLTGWAERFTGN